jgi:FkbM family methyltransferase
MFNRFNFWKTKGINPSVIYDIGANDGSWTRDMKQVYPNARYVQFEANSDHSSPDRHIVLLGNEEKEITFYKSKTDKQNTGASIYLEVSNHYEKDKYESIQLPMVKLDSYAIQNNLPQPDLIKLDVQGAEIDILNGAISILKQTQYIIMEVALHRWNKDAPMIEDVILFMKEKGFQMVDILDTHFLANYLFQIDVLFVHESTGIRRENFYGH